MNSFEAVTRTTEHIKSLLSGEGTGHDWWHVHRVWQNAKRIGREEGVDMFIVELAALLHDIADWKFHDGDDTAGPRAAHAWLEKIGVDGIVIEHVCMIINEVSFKGAGVHTTPTTREGKVVQDADRLDALGAIGIARAFAYGGHKNREIYNPGISPVLHQSFEEYRATVGTTINHFHEKLLLLKGLMNTNAGRRIAEERHRFMEAYLQRFLQEWDGRR
ncbi:MAG: HD domain-containing protein [Bacteroidota bacterium]